MMIKEDFNQLIFKQKCDVIGGVNCNDSGKEVLGRGNSKYRSADNTRVLGVLRNRKDLK